MSALGPLIKFVAFTFIQLESRVESIDVQLSKLNAELATYQQRLSKMRDGPGKNALKQKVNSHSCLLPP